MKTSILDPSVHLSEKPVDVNPSARASSALAQGPIDFSLVLGGPLYQILRRTRLSGDALQLLHRRILVLTLIAWVPLLLLSIAEGSAWGTSIVKVPFFYDVEMHLRFLIALPLLMVAEVVVHRRLRPAVQQFVERDLIPNSAQAQFEAAIAAAVRLRNSVMAEMLLIAIVYVVGVFFIWRTRVALDTTIWYGAAANGKLHLSLAGWWLACVSLPLFQFLMLRWGFRIFIWARFLWMVSRINLKLVPTHPDRCGGLGFLADPSYAFTPLLLVQGTLLAGLIADRIFFAGASLTDFEIKLAAALALMMLIILGPLFAFSLQLMAAWRAGLGEYGTLALRYAGDFDTKWLRGGARADEQLIGSADIQSLADMSNSFEVVQSMKFVPLSLRAVLQLAVVTLLPVMPLILTMFSVKELLDMSLKSVFPL